MSDSARAKAADHYAAERPDMAQQLAFFKLLWEAQDTIAEEAKVAFEPASREDSLKALQATRTLFSLKAPSIPADTYRRAVATIAALMAEHAGLAEETSAALSAADWGSAITDEAVEKILSGFDVFVQGVADRLGDTRLSEPVLSYLLSEALTPLLREPAKAAAKAAGDYDWMQWGLGLCPVCGTPASSGVVRDEGESHGGRRWLSCPMCRTSWEYARVRCARCGTREPQQLSYLYDDADPGHRVHTCAVCHGYIPVVFERDLGKRIAIVEVEEIVMVPLEQVAGSRGFTPLGDDAAEVAH